MKDNDSFKYIIIATSCAPPIFEDGIYKVQVSIAMPHLTFRKILGFAFYKSLIEPLSLYIGDRLVFKGFEGVGTYANETILYDLYEFPILKTSEALNFVWSHLNKKKIKIDAQATYDDIKKEAEKIVFIAQDSLLSIKVFDAMISIYLYKAHLYQESDELFSEVASDYKKLWYVNYLCMLINNDSKAHDLKQIFIFLASTFGFMIDEKEFYLAANSVLEKKKMAIH